MITRSGAKLLFAILGGAAASTGITTGALMALNTASGSARLGEFLAAHLAWFGLSFVVTALIAGTLGIGWHAHASRHGWRGVHAYWAPGALVGSLMPMAIFLSTSGASFLMIMMTIFGAALGGLTGLFAWLIRRPDRDPANPPT